MTNLRVGTRGSDLARWQTNWVCDRLRAAHDALVGRAQHRETVDSEGSRRLKPAAREGGRSAHGALEIEQVIIKTHGDTSKEQLFNEDWPVGGFVGAIEQALAANTIDFAVHSYKDLPTALTPGLTIAAVPERERVHDLLFTREPVDIDHLKPGFKVATSSPRRAAQFRRLGDVQIVPIRGNVATRLAKLEREGLDGVILAAAGVTRLGLSHPHTLALPTDRFVPSPAQGALAVQSRDEPDVIEIIGVLNHTESSRRVEAERSFLKTIGAGCHVPVGALAVLEGAQVRLHGQLFSDDGTRLAEGIEQGESPVELGENLAKRLMAELRG